MPIRSGGSRGLWRLVFDQRKKNKMKRRRARTAYTNWDNLMKKWSGTSRWWEVDKDWIKFVSAVEEGKQSSEAPEAKNKTNVEDEHRKRNISIETMGSLLGQPDKSPAPGGLCAGCQLDHGRRKINNQKLGEANFVGNPFNELNGGFERSPQRTHGYDGDQERDEIKGKMMQLRKK